MGSCLGTRIKAESPSQASSPSVHRNNVAVLVALRCRSFVKGKEANRSVKNGGSGNSNSNRVSAASTAPTPRNEGEILQSSTLKVFSFNDLKTCTGNFRPTTVLGEGGFGSVFKGWIDESNGTASKPGTGVAVAVKKLNPDSFQGHTEWLAEINYLGRFRHPNLVKLIGYCLEDEHRLLVYEFMQRGSLENHLFRRGGSCFQPLSWNLRMKVALEAARGLAFLHSAEINVIYRDLKASNILLDADYNAKLSDLGLAKDSPTDDKSHVSTRVMGTRGYAAPEYMATGHLTPKCDVYSYGVLLLEMISGRRALSKNHPPGQQNLVEWARPYLTTKRKVFRVLDGRLEGQYSLRGAHEAATLAHRCLSIDARYRPTMKEVVGILEQLVQTNQDAPNHSHRSNSSHTTRNVARSTTRDVHSRRTSGTRQMTATERNNKLAQPKPPSASQRPT